MVAQLPQIGKTKTVVLAATFVACAFAYYFFLARDPKKSKKQKPPVTNKKQGQEEKTDSTRKSSSTSTAPEIKTSSSDQKTSKSDKIDYVIISNVGTVSPKCVPDSVAYDLDKTHANLQNRTRLDKSRFAEAVSTTLELTQRDDELEREPVVFVIVHS
ncbi:unnamed protein product [Thelazia callipaeda]|uniref:Peroxisome assembly protein 22 n=1 Tax=Thelazia callipaeda TaxID=103827 RepID=A0A0N5CXB4_THECL|nr:unnamed protein product [Thelazia callipaeda]